MNCASVHRRLLELEHLDQPPADLRKHLAVCAVCRACLEQLEQIERDVPRLAVPGPSRKTAFFERFAQEVPAPRSGLLRFGQRERGLRKMAVAVALAAAMLLVAFGVWLWKQDDTGNPSNTGGLVVRKSPLQARLDADARWEQARTPKARVKILDELAAEVEGKALALARSPALGDLETQVRLYAEVINQLTDKEAPEISAEERELLRPIAGRLAAIQSEARRLVMDAPAARKPLEELAYVAGEGDRKLRALMA